MGEFDDPNTDLVAVVAQMLRGAPDGDQVERELSRRFPDSFRRFRVADGYQDIGLLANHSHDYVLVINFADTSVMLVDKEYCGTIPCLLQLHPNQMRGIFIKSPLAGNGGIRIIPSAPGEENMEWWEDWVKSNVE
jgi:hypothetical protein